jgi:hypothetical protein
VLLSGKHALRAALTLPNAVLSALPASKIAAVNIQRAAFSVMAALLESDDESTCQGFANVPLMRMQ